MGEVQSEIVQDLILDGGPAYAETGAGTFLIEPWNAVSSLAIAVPAVYWAIKLRGRYKDFAFLVYCMPFLLLNGLGSAFYHAFRSSRFFLFLDVVPAAILSLSVSVFFWLKVLRHWWQILFVVLPVFYLRYLAHTYFPMHTAINLSYALTGIMIFLPVLKYMVDTQFKHWPVILTAVVSLVLALLFREMDVWPTQPFPMGTHFIWHVLSAVGGYYLALYLYRMRKLELDGQAAVA
jgi:hypothetical protein